MNVLYDGKRAVLDLEEHLGQVNAKNAKDKQDHATNKPYHCQDTRPALRSVEYKLLINYHRNTDEGKHHKDHADKKCKIQRTMTQRCDHFDAYANLLPQGIGRAPLAKL